MTRKYKLISVINQPTQINVATRKKGYLQYGHQTLQPGKVYILPDDDPTLATSLLEATFRKEYSAQIEQMFKNAGVPYTVEMCKVCGGRRKKIVYHPVEEVVD